jgi:large subunit ribosomal protein L6
MSFFSKRVGIKIPTHIKVLYNQKKNHLMFIGPLGIKIIMLKFKLFVSTKENYIYIASYLGKISKKYIKSFCGTLQSQLKQIILDLSVKYHKTLKLFGVGFKAYSIKIGSIYVLQFKLGFSHFIFYKIPQDVGLFSLKQTKLYLTNPCLKKITQISAIIRSFKFPDIYKGKGILYSNEKIALKKGKKIS